MITKNIKEETVKRLKKIEGQIKGIIKMIEERRYCVDVIMQIAAAKSALHKTSEIIMRNHLQTCVLTAFNLKNEKDIQQKVDELMEIYSKFGMK